MPLSGLPAAPGVAIGPACVLHRGAAPVPIGPRAPERIPHEQRRFIAARDECVAQLAALRDKARREDRASEADLLDAHGELLADQELDQDITARISGERLSAEQAVQRAFEQILRDLDGLAAGYARERAQDFVGLQALLLRALAGVSAGGAQRWTQPAVLVGRDLTASDTAALDIAQLLAVVSETGGATAHLAIIARSLDIPAVVAVPDACSAIRDGDLLIVDGTEGQVLVNPPDAVLSEYQRKQAADVEEQRELGALRDAPAVTRDGVPLRLCANIATTAEADAALRQGAEGVGLLRTEWLFLDRATPPDEEEQFQAYCRVLARMAGRRVIIRTLDVGGDKRLPYLPLPVEANPFLGRRAIRLYSDTPELIRAQLRAILRAGRQGPVAVMFPMIVSPDEVLALRAWFRQAAEELARSGIPADAAIPLGIMIETPAAAVIADRLIEHADFFSIGVNDLTQYTLAADRSSPHVAAVYDPLHPAVLRLIAMAVQATHAAGKWIGVCGELAGESLATELLLGLGVDELSMSPNRIPHVKQALRRCTHGAARALAQEALRAGTAREVRQLLSR
jgi:phosphoenolpyruvate-protein phosphotransferase (PTS system enzyme I)